MLIVLLGAWLLASGSPARALPTAQQLVYQQRELSMFLHFSMCTFAGCEQAACHSDLPVLFNPTTVNATQWVETAASLGAQEACLTARHSGGFALWPSAHTNYSVKQSPWKQGTRTAPCCTHAASTLHSCCGSWYATAGCSWECVPARHRHQRNAANLSWGASRSMMLADVRTSCMTSTATKVKATSLQNLFPHAGITPSHRASTSLPTGIATTLISSGVFSRSLGRT